MSLGFKRVISSIMAFVMMVSTLVMVNVASVSAAASDFYLTAEDFYDGQTTSTSKIEPVLSADAKAAGVTIDTSTNYYYAFGTRAGAEVANTTGKEFTNEVRLGGGRDIKFTPASNGTVTAYVYVNNSNASAGDRSITVGSTTETLTTGNTVLKISGACTANEEFTISTNKSDVVLLALEYVSSTVTYSWTLNTDSLQNVDKTKVSIDTTATGATNTLSYSGTDYVVKNSALAEGSTGVVLNGTIFTVTVTDDMFLPVTENMTINISGAANKTLKLVGANNGYTFNIQLDENGGATQIALVQDTYTMSIDGGTLATGTVTIGPETTAITDTFTPNEIVTFKKTLNASDLTAETISADKLTADNMFKFIAAADKNIVIDGNNKTFTVADGTEIEAAQRIKMGGTGSYNERAIQFKTAEAGQVYVYAMSSKNGEARALAISDGTDVQTGEPVSDTVAVTVFTVEANKTYSLYSSNSGINIYYIGSTAQLVAFEEITDTTVSETTTETTTATTTESTTEAPTESTTEAQEPAVGGYVAVPSTHNLNETYFGGAENVSAAESEEGVTVNNITFISLADAGQSNHIRVNSDSKVQFRVESDATVAIRFESNDLSISDGTTTVTCKRDGVTTVNLNLTAGTVYTLSGVGGNARLSLLDFTAGHTGTDIADIGSTETTTEEPTETTTEQQPENNVDISVSMTGNTGDVKVSINGTSYTFAANETKTISVAEGEKVKFDFDNNVAKCITGWTGIDPDSYDSKTQAYFTTIDAAAEGTVISLTYDGNAQTTSIDEDFMTVTPDTGNVLQYGNYGYGQTKGTGIGAVKAEGVAQLNSVSGVVTLYDYMGGYGSTDERLILNDAASVTFKTEGPGYLVLDCSLGTPYVTIGGAAATPTAIGSTGKQGYTISAADMEVVITKPEGGDRSLHLKSVRYQTSGNVITVEEASDADYTAVYNSLSSAQQAEFGEVPDNKVFAKIVASLSTATADAETVDAIGVLVIDKATADAEITNDSKVFIPTNYINDSDDSNNIIVLTEEDALYDGIYDEAVPADGEGEYTLDSSTSYSDGIYYMLRYIAVAQGDYYVMPYTVINGNAAFDEGQFTNVADLEKYKINFDGVQ